MANVTRNVDENYVSLDSILRQAYERAAIGKGKERHGNNQAFKDQPMQSISEFLGSEDGMAYQVLKKLHESRSLPFHQGRNELLDCIVYLAGIVLYRDKQCLKAGGYPSPVSVTVPSAPEPNPFKDNGSIDDFTV